MAADPNFLSAASAFDSFKNYGSFSDDVTVSGTVGFGIGTDFTTFSTSFDLERTDVITQVYMQTTVDPGKTFSLVGNYVPLRTGSTTSLPSDAPYNLQFTFTYVGSVITCQASIVNPYGETLTLVTETITFIVKTFIGPFVN